MPTWHHLTIIQGSICEIGCIELAMINPSHDPWRIVRVMDVQRVTIVGRQVGWSRVDVGQWEGSGCGSTGVVAQAKLLAASSLPLMSCASGWKSWRYVPVRTSSITVGSKYRNTHRGTCLPAPVLKKVLSPPPLVLTLGICPSGCTKITRSVVSSWPLQLHEKICNLNYCKTIFSQYH